MSIAVIQAHSLVLPQYYVLGTETEDIDDLLEHTSVEFHIADIHEKMVNIIAVENNAGGALQNLQWWVELSPVPSTVSAAYWSAILGGGGAIAPTVPNVIVPTGVDGTGTPDMIAWVMHSVYARVVVQCPVNAGLPGDFWQVQVVVQGKTP